MRALRPLTPPEVGATGQAIRALAALDDAALERVRIDDAVPPPDSEGWFARWFGGRRRARREELRGWLRAALEPWRRPGLTRSFGMRTDDRILLGKFAERPGEVLAVVVVLPSGAGGVRVLTSSDYFHYGHDVSS